jgi:hypothetical protein
VKEEHGKSLGTENPSMMMTLMTNEL